MAISVSMGRALRYIRRSTIFALSAMLGAALLVACGGGSEDANQTPNAAGGAAIYARYCQVCHPGGGEGAGPAIRTMAAALSDQQLTDVIRHGKTRMPGFTDAVIPDNQLPLLIQYIRELK